jgi:hypothetical protein
VKVKGDYIKLIDGSWGLCVVGRVSPGDTVAVNRPNGTVHNHKVAEVISQDHGVRLCTLVPVTRERLAEVYGEPAADRIENAQ